jgi:NSS family neurotransmitter:Na+ symporter
MQAAQPALIVLKSRAFTIVSENRAMSLGLRTSTLDVEAICVNDKPARGSFATNFGFLMAAVGSAVGLGNIWKFPYITGEYGGGAFVLVYLACIALIGLPLMYAELMIGRRGGKGILGSMRKLARTGSRAPRVLSNLTGGLAVVAGFLILSFYAVVAGWAVHFLVISAGLLPGSVLGAEGTFDALAGNALISSVWHSVFMLMTIVVVVAGVHQGIEKLCKALMPALVIMLIGLLFYVGYTGGLGQSLAFLFNPDFSKLTGEAVLEALGHAFFTLSLGMGAMVTYGSYLKSEKHIVRDGMVVAALDTLIALLAGTVIFAVVFAAGQPASGGPGLLFKTLPTLFAAMPGGAIVSSVFFLLVIFAAWSSAVSLLEVVVAYFVDERNWSRRQATWVMGGLIWAMGLFSACSPQVLDFLDNLATRYLLPLGGLAIAIFAGWFVTREDQESGFGGRFGQTFAAAWRFLIRFVTPTLVLIVILWQIGLIEI